MRIIGMDIHRSFAQVAVLEDGRITRQFRLDLVHGPVTDFARTLSREDDVVLEATGNSAAVERLLRPHVRRVVVANSRVVRAIAYARVKTDKIDAATLARLHAAGFLPEVWTADDETLARRRQIAERMGVLGNWSEPRAGSSRSCTPISSHVTRDICLARRGGSGSRSCRCPTRSAPCSDG